MGRYAEAGLIFREIRGDTENLIHVRKEIRCIKGAFQERSREVLNLYSSASIRNVLCAYEGVSGNPS